MNQFLVRNALWILGSALLAGVSVADYYYTIRKYLQAWDDWHVKLIDGGMGAPLHYRVLSYWLPELIVRATDVQPWMAPLSLLFFNPKVSRPLRDSSH